VLEKALLLARTEGEHGKLVSSLGLKGDLRRHNEFVRPAHRPV